MSWTKCWIGVHRFEGQNSLQPWAHLWELRKAPRRQSARTPACSLSLPLMVTKNLGGNKRFSNRACFFSISSHALCHYFSTSPAAKHPVKPLYFGYGKQVLHSAFIGVIITVCYTRLQTCHTRAWYFNCWNV